MTRYGDPDLESIVGFKDLPEDWVCPICERVRINLLKYNTGQKQ